MVSIVSSGTPAAEASAAEAGTVTVASVTGVGRLFLRDIRVPGDAMRVAPGATNPGWDLAPPVRVSPRCKPARPGHGFVDVGVTRCNPAISGYASSRPRRSPLRIAGDGRR